MKNTNLPGFTAEASLVSTLGIYSGNAVFGRLESGEVMPQFRIQLQSGTALDPYLRCMAIVRNPLICSFLLRPPKQ